MQKSLWWLLKLGVIIFFLSVVAGVFSWQLISMRIERHLLSKQRNFQGSSQISGLNSSFFYNTIGSSPQSLEPWEARSGGSASLLSQPVTGSGADDDNAFSLFPSEGDDESTTDSPAPPEQSFGGYTIKVADVGSSDEAFALRDQLNDLGFPVTISALPSNNPLAPKTFRITMGLLSTYKGAEESLKALTERTHYRGVIMALPSASPP